MLDLLAEVLSRDGLLRSGDSGVVAFSGGADSLCLLHLLQRLSTESGWGLNLAAVVVDHGLRPESADEARRAVELARGLGVEADLVEAGLGTTVVGGVEERARGVRYEILARCAAQRDSAWVAFAHTANDQAETVLMRMVRGAGGAGLAGMPMSRRLGEARLIRPLLGIGRQAIEDYLHRHRLVPVVDPTNTTDAHFRNRVRRQLLPLLRRENPEVVAALGRLASSCREESEALAWCGDRHLQRLSDGEGGIFIPGILALPRGLQHHLFRQAHRQVVGSLLGLERRHLDGVRRLAEAEAHGTSGIDLPGARVVRRYDRIHWQTHTTEDEQLQPFVISRPGHQELVDGRLLTVTSELVDDKTDPASVLDPGRVSFPMVVRSYEPGDRIAVGDGQHQKVSRVLIDAKVPRSSRLGVPVVVADGVVVMVVGLRRAHGLGCGVGETGLVVRLHLQQPCCR